MKFIIFDLDDTLLCGDCEAGWINFLVSKELLDGDKPVSYTHLTLPTKA